MKNMDIRIIKDSITREELKKIASEQFGDLVKAVVDIEKEVMAIGGDLHADEEVVLTEQEGSKREHTWGVNLYPDNESEDFVEFDSMINLKPNFGNRSRSVENEQIRGKIRSIVDKLIKK